MTQHIKSTLIATTLLLASLAWGQEWAREHVDASPRHQEWVNVQNGDRTVKCFIVYPEREDKTQVIVLIHEIMGMTDWVMWMADQLAEAGYIVIAPDLLSGMAPGGGRSIDFETASKAREAVSNLPPEQVTADLNAACDYGKAIASANGKVSVAGFCWGGSQTFRFATNRDDLSAAFVFYGTGPTDASAIDRIKSPVYGFYGGRDNRVNASIPASESLMKSANKTYEPEIYDGAGHGFMRSGQQPGAQAANTAGRDAAWKRWLDLLSSA